MTKVVHYNFNQFTNIIIYIFLSLFKANDKFSKDQSIGLSRGNILYQRVIKLDSNSFKSVFKNNNNNKGYLGLLYINSITIFYWENRINQAYTLKCGMWVYFILSFF